jgi:hypothetical protein
VLKMVPSDPDFPFEIDALACILRVPLSYPEAKPSLRVTNKEMGRGYQINVERGFDGIVQRLPNGTLLQYLNALDKQLEVFLAAPKVETVKILANVMKKHQEAESSRAGSSRAESSHAESSRVESSRAAIEVPRAEQKIVPIPSKPIYTPPAPVYTSEQIAQARSKRETDVRQLEARLGRLPQYRKSSDGLGYTLPLEPRKRGNLPVSLQAIKTVQLIVPELYNLEPCRIQLQGVNGQDATHLEDSFRLRALENANLTLVAHINYFSQNMHTMASKPSVIKTPDVIPFMKIEEPAAPPQAAPRPEAQKSARDEAALDDRSHIITIPRPPEWSVGEGDDDGSDDSYSYDSGDESDEDEDDEDDAVANSQPSGPERGIMLSLPFLELHGIELLELVSLSLTIKCDRCKTTVDLPNIKNNPGDSSGVRSESCRKCANAMDIGDIPRFQRNRRPRLTMNSRLPYGSYAC